MAVLSQTPFQLPDFAKMAYEKSLVDEEKQRREEERQEAKRNQRERTIEGYGAKKNYLEKSFALEPAAKQIADVAFQEVQKYGTLYEQTNSQEALANFERAVGQFNQILGTGLAVRQSVDGEYETLKKSPSSFSLESQKSGEEAYRKRSNMNFAGAIENGVLMATDPSTGKRVPVTQLSYFQSSVVPGVNTLGLVPVDPATKFINPVDYAQRLVNDFKDTQGVRIDSGKSVTYDKNSLIRKGRASFESDLNNNPAMMDAVIMRHYLKSTGKTPPPQERSQIIVDYNSNPEKLKAAQDTYWSDVSSNITSFVPAASIGATSSRPTRDDKANGPGRLTNADLNELDAFFTGLPSPTTDASGNVTIAPQNYSVKIGGNDLAITDLTFDKKGNLVWAKADFSGLPSMTGRPTTAQLITTVQQNLKQRNIYKAVGETAVEAVNAKGGTPK